MTRESLCLYVCEGKEQVAGAKKWQGVHCGGRAAREYIKYKQEIRRVMGEGSVGVDIGQRLGMGNSQCWQRQDGKWTGKSERRDLLMFSQGMLTKARKFLLEVLGKFG